MRQLYAFLIVMFTLGWAGLHAQTTQPQFETPCSALTKLFIDFPNNFETYLGDQMETDMFAQDDKRFQSKISIPGTRETYFYTEMYKNTNIFYTRIFEGPDSTMAATEFGKWRSKIEGCTTFPFGSLATAETDDGIEKKVTFYPFDVTGEMEKVYGHLSIEFKIFRWNKIADNGKTVPQNSVELRILRM